MNQTELDRVENEEVPRSLPPLPFLLMQAAGPAVEQSLEKIREVVRLIVVATWSSSEWPSSQDWKAILPPWFLSTFEGVTLKEVEKFDHLWLFESWLQAIYGRGWMWWGAEAKSQMELRIVLAIDSIPYSIEAFEYLVRVSGAEPKFTEEIYIEIAWEEL